MAEKRLIDGKRLYRKLIELHKLYGSCDFEHKERKIENKREIDTIFRCMDYVKSAPTIDAVEVVRCGECKFRDTEDCPMSECVESTPTKGFIWKTDQKSEYCSYGEKESEGK